MEFENDGAPVMVIVKVGSPHQRRKWMRYEWVKWFWKSYESQFEIADSTIRGSANGCSSTATNARVLFYGSGMFKVVQKRDKYVSVRRLCWKWVTLKWEKLATFNVLMTSCLTFWHRSFTFISNKSPTWCNNFSVCYPDVCLQLNMFRAFSCPSSGAQWLQWQPLVLPSYRGDSRAVFVVGPAGRPYHEHSTIQR